MAQKLSRRDFLKLSALGAASLAFRPMRHLKRTDNLSENSLIPMGGDIARVCVYSVSVHSQPWDESKILYQRYQDELVNLYYEVESEHGPEYNPIWYRVWGGYIHSAHLQCVRSRENTVLYTIPEERQLAEVTVPFTTSMRYASYNGWTDLYRLYYNSVHWLVDVDTGPDGEPWYLIEDELDSSYKYWAKASHFRPVPAHELTPISPDVPPHEKRIEVSIARQTLTAYEGDNIVLQTKVSTGLNYKPKGETPWDTPTGTFNVYSKMPSKHMGDGHVRSDYLADDYYELPGVPWVCFFEESGVATHGTYWHTNYGTRMSHGCVNMRNDEAKWLFRWTTPVAQMDKMESRGMGTRVIVT